MITIISDIEINHPHYKLINWFFALSTFSCECSICKSPAVWSIPDILKESHTCRAKDQAMGYWVILRPYSKTLCNPTQPSPTPVDSTATNYLILDFSIDHVSMCDFIIFMHFIINGLKCLLEIGNCDTAYWLSPNIHSPLLLLPTESPSFGWAHGQPDRDNIS